MIQKYFEKFFGKKEEKEEIIEEKNTRCPVGINTKTEKKESLKIYLDKEIR